MQNSLFRTFITNIIDLAFQVMYIFCMRYLLDMSTPRKYWIWLKNQPIYNIWFRARWYRGEEVFHQLTAWRLLR